MGINFNFAKKFAAEQLVKKALAYLEEDPEGNFLQILDLAEKIAPIEDVQGKINFVREKFHTTPVVKKYLKKFTQLDPNYRKNLLMNFFVNSALFGLPYQKEKSEQLGVEVPWTILIDPTSNCNLNCKGCWAGKYGGETMEFDTLDRIITEAKKELGIHFIIFSGGEPTTYPYLFDICEKHDDVGFMMFTNGTLIDEEMADKMLEVGNLTPAISLEGNKENTDERRGEGTYQQLVAAMERLEERGIVFGASLTFTRNNVEDMLGDDTFVDFLVEKGVSYLWGFHYIPIGKEPNLDLMLTPEQRQMVGRRISKLRLEKPIFMIDFWNDGPYTEGCIAGGKNYFHINAQGDVEPCAFVHFATDNIKDKSLVEAIQNPLFKAYQQRQPFNDNYLLPCPIIDNPEALGEMVEETGAYPTHPGADGILQPEVTAELKEVSSQWAELSQPLREDKEDSASESA